jgi:hypothetical protein
MQAIEFDAQLQNGVIHLPASYQHWREGQHVKVIVLAPESPAESVTPTAKNINHHAGKISLSEDPLDFQRAIRDEWA